MATGKRQGQGKYVYPNRAFSYEGGYADGGRVEVGSTGTAHSRSRRMMIGGRARVMAKTEGRASGQTEGRAISQKRGGGRHGATMVIAKTGGRASRRTI